MVLFRSSDTWSEVLGRVDMIILALWNSIVRIYKLELILIRIVQCT